MTSLITRRIDSDVAQETWHIQSARSPHASATPAPLRNGNGAAGSIRAGTAAPSTRRAPAFEAALRTFVVKGTEA